MSFKSIIIPYLGLISVFLLSCGSEKTTDSNTESDSTKTKTQNTEVMLDVHTFAKPQEAVMTNLDLDIAVDFENKKIKGKAILTIDNKTGTSELFLDSKELKIEKVTLGKDETPTEFKVAPSFESMGEQVKINIKPETKLVNIYYETSPKAEALQWLTPQQTAGKKEPYLFTQSQAILARSWVPCQDSPGIRFTYSAKVQVPKQLMAVMSAENPTKKNDTGIYQFKMPQPIPAYLLALAVGDFEFAKVGDRVGVYAEPSELVAAQKEFADVPKMLKAAEELYGPYEWGRYDLIVLPPSFPFGGMENPRITFATPTIIAGDRSLTSLVAHELAHSWSGNLVTNATWDDFWLNEGFTVYFERRIMEAIEGKEYADMLAYLGYQDLEGELESMGKDNEDTRLKISLKGRNPDDGVTSIAYEKGYFFLRMIEDEVGRAKMDTFLRNYFQKYAFTSMNTERFLVHLKEALPETEKLNLKEWIYEPGLPANCPKIESKRFIEVDKALTAWQGGKAASELNTKDWSSHEWLYFIRKLPKELSQEKLKELDDAFGFTNSGNSEILAAWFIPAIQNGYAPADAAIEKFLIKVGRRKFLVPIYKALLEAKGGKEKAKVIYAKARPNYHFVAVNTLDEMMK
jgi:leukotriene A-4 hydrolase/aminopeptidase